MIWHSSRTIVALCVIALALVAACTPAPPDTNGTLGTGRVIGGANNTTGGTTGADNGTGGIIGTTDNDTGTGVGMNATDNGTGITGNGTGVIVGDNVTVTTPGNVTVVENDTDNGTGGAMGETGNVTTGSSYGDWTDRPNVMYNGTDNRTGANATTGTGAIGAQDNTTGGIGANNTTGAITGTLGGVGVTAENFTGTLPSGFTACTPDSRETICGYGGDSVCSIMVRSPNAAMTTACTDESCTATYQPFINACQACRDSAVVGYQVGACPAGVAPTVGTTAGGANWTTGTTNGTDTTNGGGTTDGTGGIGGTGTY